MSSNNFQNSERKPKRERTYGPNGLPNTTKRQLRGEGVRTDLGASVSDLCDRLNDDNEEGN